MIKMSYSNQLLSLIFAISSVIILPASITACGSLHQHETAGQFVDGSVITSQVKTKLLADKSISGLPISVETYKNTVQLSGFVETNLQKLRAESIARSVEGVGNVENSLVVKK